MRLTEERLKEIIKEEVELYLLVEESERILIEEGVISWVKKKLGLGWEADIEQIEGEVEETGKLSKETFLSLPSASRIGALALVAFFTAGGTQFLTDYADYAQQSELQAAQRFGDGLAQSRERAQDITNFRDLAQASAEGATEVSTPEQVNDYLDSMRMDHMGDFEQAPLATQYMFVDGDVNEPVTGFAYVPYEDIGDDEILPFMGMNKKDFELFLRMNWLAGDAHGDERLRDYVYGGGRAGSSIFWSYENSLYSPLVDDSGSDPAVRAAMEKRYTAAGDQVMMLPLEWSVAHHLAQLRANKGANK